MTEPMTCTFPDREHSAQAYARDRLSADGKARFEEHLMSCASCQDDVLLAVTVRGELRRKASTAWTPQRIRVAAGLAAAAAIVALAGMRYATQRELRALGSIGELPSYGGVAVRSARARGDSLFAEGMRSYSAARLGDALRLLAEARTLGADSVPTSFFIGVLRLRAGDAMEAQRNLAVVIRHGPNPYAAEAHFYSAKAWLTLARADTALAHLVAAASSSTPIAPTARALADSLAEVGR